jgi:hypothetical protein
MVRKSLRAIWLRVSADRYVWCKLPFRFPRSMRPRPIFMVDVRDEIRETGRQFKKLFGLGM